jgi:MYXO-CTERM domain-containing protein
MWNASPPDAGMPDAGPGPAAPPAGCGCRTGGPGSAAPALLVALALLRRRRSTAKTKARSLSLSSHLAKPAVSIPAQLYRSLSQTLQVRPHHGSFGKGSGATARHACCERARTGTKGKGSYFQERQSGSSTAR